MAVVRSLAGRGREEEILEVKNPSVGYSLILSLDIFSLRGPNRLVKVEIKYFIRPTLNILESILNSAKNRDFPDFATI